ncbi:alanine acetyltransferase [Burkholderia ubonensis]|uniref:[Ribosomal protein uS5]-alanine N-acetyltransferase n=1 Tax=Burkholderia ubonensis TaxID=101571 RepID=A0A107J7P2_9BURK|nr:GNAT family N-acetyltransferase [Burkholderia ubonensis]KWE70079.1 alanine acetyltransferase [Burkholderia ubonensis]KWE80643.1 alanine acetyltransferase [Burkholderia ubonensis]KWK82120.1 alanine acetyltransferase [Burkholderia ubonensis]
MKFAIPILPNPLVTDRLLLRPANRAYAPDLLAYYIENRTHLMPWEPSRPDSFYTRHAIETRLQSMEENIAAGRAVHLLIFDKDDDRLIGDCNFTQIVPEPFRACYLGFSIARDCEGRGLMHESLDTAIRYVFDELALHRVMANHRPENRRSARLLERLGFEREGYARAYLRINGAWADHVLTALINPAPV